MTEPSKFGPDILVSDHIRGCRGREYECTCGYDQAKDEEIERLRQVLDDIASARMLWHGGIGRPPYEQVAGLVQDMKEMARESLKNVAVKKDHSE